MKSFVSLLATLSVLLTQHALASEPLTATLEVRKVVRNDDGKQQLLGRTPEIYDSTPAYTVFTSAACGTLANGLTS